MEEYTVQVTTTYTTYISIEAESEEEALEKAQYDVENAMVLVEEENTREVDYEIN